MDWQVILVGLCVALALAYLARARGGLRGL